MSDVTLEKQIGDTERRLEMRRERVARHVQEIRAETDDRLRAGMKWAPLVAVGALGAMAFTAGRRHGQTASPARVHRANGANATVAITSPKPNGTSSFATLASVAGVVARAALSPQARELWQLYVSRRRH
jgi:hypothetical protein